jgi:hypothetical protein
MAEFKGFATSLAFVSLASFVACGGSSVSPTAPGNASDGSAFNSGTAQASGLTVRSANSNHAPKFVEGNAVVVSVVTSCPTLSFMVEGHLITTDETTRYSAGTCDDVIPGRPVTIQGTLSAIDGSVAASHIVLKGNHPTFVEGDIVVPAVTGTCATAKSFVVDGHTVTTIPTTTYDGGTCADLIAGARVQIKGLLLPDDGSVTATGIKFKHDDVDD